MKRKMKRKSKKNKPESVEKPVKQRRAPRLPGMEDPAIEDLEQAAVELAELRSQVTANRAADKIKLREAEQLVVALMKQNQKTTYNHAGIRLRLREGHDSVSVQVKRHDKE